MSRKPRIRPKCSACGKCCKEQGHTLTTGSEDYKRWKRQRRCDILQYVWVPQGSNGFGDIWINPETGEDLDYCPFLTKVGPRKYACSIQDTKPTICRQFWCEWAYGVGKKGIPFKTIGGWSEKAKQLGYDRTRKRISQKVNLLAFGYSVALSFWRT